jgi:hypothetical protein
MPESFPKIRFALLSTRSYPPFRYGITFIVVKHNDSGLFATCGGSLFYFYCCMVAPGFAADGSKPWSNYAAIKRRDLLRYRNQGKIL